MTIKIHRGDCFSVMRDSIPNNSIDLIIADPPYGNILPDQWDKCEAASSYYEPLAIDITRLLKKGGTAYVWGGVGKRNDRPFLKWLSTDSTDCRS